MKIILVGCGKIGHGIAAVLSVKKDIDVTIVDINPNVFHDSSDPMDVIFIEGNGLSEKTLIEAGARNADLIISAANADEVNILCCIMAERLGTKHSVARVRDPGKAYEFNTLWHYLGIDMTINPERQTAKEMSRLLRYPVSVNVDTFVNGRVEMVSFDVSETPDFFVGKCVSQIFNRKMGVLLAVVDRNNKAIIPNGDFVFEQSDIVRILGRPSSVMQFLTNIGKEYKKEKRVMVVGGGKTTHYLAELLNRHEHRAEMIVIEKDRQRCEEMSEILYAINKRYLVIHGDGTNEEVLAASEIEMADAFVCLTDRDEENAIISLYALRMGVKNVITKINYMHQNMIKNLGLSLGSIITPQDITSENMLRYVNGLQGAYGRRESHGGKEFQGRKEFHISEFQESDIKTVHRIYLGGGGNVEAVECNVYSRSKCIGVSLQDLKLKKGILVGCIVRSSEIIIPTGATQLHEGDIAIIISKNQEINGLDDILMS